MGFSSDFNAAVTPDLRRLCDGAGFLVCIGSEDFTVAHARLMSYALERGAGRLTAAQFRTLERWVSNRIAHQADKSCPAWERACLVADLVGADIALWQASIAALNEPNDAG